MARPARFSRDQIVAATMQVAAACGPAGATVARIASALHAPTGSIYHRFASRDILLGEVWLRAASAFQTGASEQLAGPDPHAAGLAAALYVPQRVREQPQEARILLLHRQEDFVTHGWPKEMTARAKELRQQMHEGLRSFSQRLFGRTDAEALRIVSFALVEAPLAAVRRDVEAGEPPPPAVDSLIKATYLAVVALGGTRT